MTPVLRAPRTHRKCRSGYVAECRACCSLVGRHGAVADARGVDFDHAVATSKTFKQLARISGAAPSSEGQRVQRNLTLASLDEWVPKLTGMTVAQRAQLPGVSAGRAEQLLAGAIVAQETMKFFNLTSLEICPWALREGIILRRLDWFADDSE